MVYSKQKYRNRKYIPLATLKDMAYKKKRPISISALCVLKKCNELQKYKNIKLQFL
jgi:hypothetical protein